MTALQLEKKKRIINFIKKTDNPRVIEKFEQLMVKNQPELKPMTQEEYVQSLKRADEDYKAGRYKTLDEIKKKFGFAS